MENTRAEALVAAYLSGNIADDERAELMAWVDASEAGQTFFDKANQLWALTAAQTMPDFGAGKTAARTRLNERLDEAAAATPAKVRKLGGRRWLAIAATVALLLTAGYFLRPAPEVSIQMATAADERSQLSLPDGTQVWPNENSHLHYTEGKDERQVSLTGEAYFDVATDSSRAFRIYAGDAVTTVLGTAFNLRAYPDEERVEVTVTEGKVALEEAPLAEVAQADAPQRVELTAGKRGIYAEAEVTIEAKVAAPENAVAWKERQLNFNNVPLVEVVRDLQHYYDIKIELADSNLESCQLMGIYDNDPKLEFILQIIESLGFTVVQNDEVYLISGRGCD